MDPTTANAIRARRTRLAAIRQELLTPIVAIVGYGEMVQEEVERRGLISARQDVGRILVAARELLERVGRVLESEASLNARPDELLAAEARLRHALRTRLTTVCGYGELLAEELGAQVELEALLDDLAQLVRAAHGLLLQLDTIVDFSRLDEDAQAVPGLVDIDEEALDGLVQAIAPAQPDPLDRALTGRILLVDDNATLLGVLARRLEREGHEALTASEGREALELLRRQPVDVVVSDLVMPDMNGYELLQRMRSDEALRGVPVIMMSGLSETEGVVRCIEAGAIDYLVKPVNLVLLRARLAACLDRKRWRVREASYLRQIEYMAHHDPLTGLPNRGVLMRRLRATIEAASRAGRSAALLFVDLDRFKEVNDTQGHAVGDLTLKEVAGRLLSCIRQGDTAARIGGDEFAILLSSLSDPADAEQVASRIIERLYAPFAVAPSGGGVVQIGASVGVALLPEHARTAETAMRRADAAMYEVKAAGRNDFRFAQGEEE